MNLACPICGAIPSAGARDCPGCHLDVALFGPVRDAGALGRDSDPAYYRTIAELFRTADLLGPAPELPSPPAPATAELPDLPPGEATLSARAPGGPPAVPLLPMPEIPTLPRGDALRSRAHEYTVLAAELGLAMPELADRAAAAEEVGDDAALADVVREMYVHIAAAVVSGYDVEGARRNELAGRGPTEAADTELAAVRSAVGAGDLTAGVRHLARSREQLARTAEAWATERILLTECDLLAETIRELGGDPSPALGPLKDGAPGDGSPPERTELVLAQTTYALWVVLEPRFTAELTRIRDRLVAMRTEGSEVAGPLAKLRLVATEIRRRNFAGTILAYRQLRDSVGGPGPAPSIAVAVAEPERRAA